MKSRNDRPLPLTLTAHNKALAGLIEAARMLEIFATEMRDRFGYSSADIAHMIKAARLRTGRRTYADAMRGAAKMLEGIRSRKANGR
jgi:hypothetical protein